MRSAAHALVLAVVAIVLGCARAPSSSKDAANPVAPAATCLPSEADRLWMQETLDLWARTSERHLRRKATDLPWIVFYDAKCAFHVRPAREDVAAHASVAPALLRYRGEPVTVVTAPNDGGVTLPDGKKAPVAVRANASLYGSPDPRPYYTMAVISLWKATVPAAKRGPSFSDRLLTVSQHEMTHTVQLVALRRAIDAALGGAIVPPKLTDDTIQEMFESDAEYVAAFRRETDLLFEAARSSDRARMRDLATHALELARARHARWFVGDRAPFAALDGLFLSLEGPGEWVRYRHMIEAHELPHNTALARVDDAFDDYAAFRKMSPAEAIAFIRGPAPYWSQDEGLALFLVLDTLMPDWRDRVLGDHLIDAFILLDEAIRR